MGNTNTKESRGGDGHRPHNHAGLEPGTGADRSHRRHRASRGDLGIWSLGSPAGSSSQQEAPYERRETKQEREARRLERERVARLAERERSMKEEHVDGGFLVTMGTYVGPEDFNKQIVRQLQIERKLAPFWRGLNDFSDQWTEPQIIAAARGLPVPPADQTPPEDLIPRPLSAASIKESAQNLNNLTVPLGGRTQSAASELSASNPGSALPSPLSASHPPRTSSPFKPRGKAIAAVLGGNSRNGSTTEIVPREIQLPRDPFVNGQPLEVFLYKNATECPICFLTYPPYLNHTRCCDQAICSECFVQIKRPDPHFPEGHNENDPNHNPEETAGLLISEVACCPYCTQPDFGITYEPPPFRRGLAYSSPLSGFGSTAMSSSSSLNSGGLSPSVGSPLANRRRAHSLSANDPQVVTTDRVRPEWATKLQAARAHQARRAAAATALHTAAFLMGNAETRAFRTRFSRRNTGGSGSAAAGASPGGAFANAEGENGDSGTGTPSGAAPEVAARSGRAAAGRQPRSRLEDLEDMMFMEAVRLSLAAEEERKRKAEKEERKKEEKEAKKREKEERKAAKAAAKHGSPYDNAGDGRSGQSSATGSSLSLPFGRKRGNSGGSNLRVEASVSSVIAGGIGTEMTTSDPSGKSKGKEVDRGVAEPADSGVTGNAAGAAVSAPRPIPTPHQPAGPSHLRQMSSASSISSSILESSPGSFSSPSHLQDPRGSRLSLSGASEDGGDQERDRDPSATTEPMFNFRSLAEVVGVSLEGENAGRPTNQSETDNRPQESTEPASQPLPDINNSEPTPADTTATTETGDAVSTTTDEISQPGELAPPTVTITPETPVEGAARDSKQLGYETTVEPAKQETQ